MLTATLAMVFVPFYLVVLVVSGATGEYVGVWPLLGMLTAFLVADLALAWRAARPLASALVVLAISGLSAVVNPGIDYGVIAVGLVSLYSVVTRTNRRWRLVALLVVLLWPHLLVWRMSTWSGQIQPTEALAGGVAGSVVGLAVWVMGVYRGSDLVREEESHTRLALLEREREQTAALASYAERTRIAREMHDIVAHTLTGLIAQADGGRYSTDPEETMQALAVISKDGRRALADLRALLTVLRDPQDTAGRLPGQDDVTGLIEEIRRAGLEVRVEERGDPRRLPDHLGLTMFRIVQESLTNSLKHAGLSSRASVEIVWDKDLHLVIEDDGTGTGLVEQLPGGKGLLGMRERVELVGGELHAGPKQSAGEAGGPGHRGGFRVDARIPLSHNLPLKEKEN